jgi:hypothetical protein
VWWVDGPAIGAAKFRIKMSYCAIWMGYSLRILISNFDLISKIL